jgi:hypothetical protein
MVFLCLVACVSVVQADLPVPFAPLGNVTGSYDYSIGSDDWYINTNFPISSQDIVYPDWLFGMMLAFMFGTICYGLYFMSKDPAPWVNVIACGIVMFGLGLSAALMAPLVGYTQVFHQIINIGTVKPVNLIYVNEIVVYTMGTWISWACYGIAIGGGLLFVIAGFLLQMKQARVITNQVQQEKIMGGEIDFRTKEWRGR